MNPQQEALIAIGIFFMIMLIAVIVILLFSIREQRIENQMNMLKLNVIIDNLIEIVRTKKYGNEDEQE